MRGAEVNRKTNETDIRMTLNLDGGTREISTGIGFFDHMMTAFAVHGGFGLSLDVKGDLEVDCHHTIEDVGIVLGKVIAEAVGDKRGIARFGSCLLPMDETLAECVLDISGRPYFVINGAETLQIGSVGGFDCCMVEEFFRAVAMNSGLTLHLNIRYGRNAHHIIEAMFKAFARALKQAVVISGNDILSSKGTL